jgi:hypothetical protein
LKRQRNSRNTTARHPSNFFSVFGPINDVSAFYTHENRKMVPDSLRPESSHNSAAHSGGAAAVPEAPRVFEERHYTVAEVAALWNLSVDAVRKLFRNEPGVLVLGRNKRRGTRGYMTLRIPQSVLERVYRQITLG